MKRLILVLAVGAIIIVGFTSVFGQTVSDEARRHFDRGTAAVELAKSPDDYEAAIKEFKQAIDLAPDWADAYFNLGKVQEQAEKFVDAIASLKKYLNLAPNATDAETVKSLINKLEFKAENTLTKADIFSVFASLSKWEAKGNCAPLGPTTYSFSYITPKSEGFINVLDWTFWVGLGGEAAKTSQAVKIEGTTVKYTWAKLLCGSWGPGCDPLYGSSTLEEEIEVVSKTRVKVKQVVVKYGTKTSEVSAVGRLGQRFECELSPPK
jgi:hypothetical protein